MSKGPVSLPRERILEIRGPSGIDDGDGESNGPPTLSYLFLFFVFWSRETGVSQGERETGVDHMSRRKV